MFWARAFGAAGVLVLVGAAGAKTQITIWGGGAAPPPATSATGGVDYGGYTPTTGAYVVQSRDVELPAQPGEIRFAGVPGTVDAASVHLTGDGIHVLSQRFVPGAKTPTEALARGVGGAVTVVTQKGEVTGTLRAVDDTSVVVELAGGGMSVMRRDGYVQDIRLAAAPKDVDKPSLVWRVQAKQPGKHPVEVAYRAEGLEWRADYLAVLDEAGANVDFSAWASIKNATAAQFDDAELVLVPAAPTLPGGAPPTGDAAGLMGDKAPKRPSSARFAVPGAVTLGPNETVQVELVPPRVGAKPRTVVSYEALPDQSGEYQDFPNTDCSQSAGGPGSGPGTAEVALEVDLPANATLPAGRVRLFQKKQGTVELVSDDPLAVVAGGGAARLRLAPDAEIEGERKATGCDFDELNRTLKEKVSVTVKSKAKKPLDVVVREYMWRAPMYRLDEPGWKKPATGQAEEKRLHLAPGGKASWNYTVVYTWQ